MTDRLTIRRPDDWHVHLRDGAMLTHVAPYTARQFARAIVMPNLSPPVTTVDAGRAYRERIVAAVPAALDFTPLIVAYLTDGTDAEEMARGHAEGVFTAAKLYPAHATTGSAHGVTDVATVSYTHLDVYKRQGIGTPRPIIGIEGGDRPQAFGIGVIGPADDCICLLPRIDQRPFARIQHGRVPTQNHALQLCRSAQRRCKGACLCTEQPFDPRTVGGSQPAPAEQRHPLLRIARAECRKQRLSLIHI